MPVRNVLRFTRFRAVLAVVIVALAATVGGFAYSELRRVGGAENGAKSQSAPPSVSAMFDYKPTLLVVGDSFAGGTGDPRFVTYPHLVAERMGWSLALDAQGATGFVNGVADITPPHVPFIDRLDHDAATYRVDYVLIDGGRNDLGIPPDRVVVAADEYIKKVRSIWPNATIVIMLPAYATREEATNYPALAAGLRRTAESVGAYVIDPVAEGWYRDIDLAPMMWNDGVHLNAEGNEYYADKIIEDLKRMGLAK